MKAARAQLLFLASALLAPSVASAETVDQIVARHLAARGGRQALAAVRTLRMTGHADAGPGRHAIVRREFARPDRIRTEFEFQGTTGVYVWNGKSGWQVSPLDGQFDVQPLSPEAAALSAEQADIEGPLVDWKAKGHSVELLGRAELPGGRRGRAEGHAEIGRRASRLGGREVLSRGEDGVHAEGQGARDDLRGGVRRLPRDEPAFALRARSRSRPGAGRNACASSSTAWR